MPGSLRRSLASPGPTLWLSCHVDYACRHSGACCGSGWPLPVEAAAVGAINAAVAGGQLATEDGHPIWLYETTDVRDGIAGTFRLVANACVFHTTRAGGGRHCAVHSTLGHDALPSSCQHFPRVCLTDGRGVRVSLSHYCPTAAEMLLDHVGPVRIMEGPPAVPGRFVPEGLDARDALPPQLTPTVLTDLDGLSAWEAHVVATLAGPASEGSPEHALARVAFDAHRLATWRPGRGRTLHEAIDGLASDAPGAQDIDSLALALLQPDAWRHALRVASAACRVPWTWSPAPDALAVVHARRVAPAWPEHADAVRRYLAAKAFGSWLTYQSDAATGLAAWLRLCLGVLHLEAARACQVADRLLDRRALTEAVRQSDLLLVHYADGLALARALTRR